MKGKSEYTEGILHDIFALDDPAIDKSRKDEIPGFITGTINGDIPQRHFSVNIENTVAVFILTNLRVIKVDIDEHRVWSSSFVLNAITIRTQKLLGEERMQTGLVFQGNSLGLVYPTDDQEAIEFFRAIDDLRVRQG